MRLTLVISSLRRGGAERLASILASAWAAEGQHVSLLTLDSGAAPSYPLHPAINVAPLGLESVSRGWRDAVFRNFSRIRLLRKAIRSSRPDVVISFMDATNVLVLLAARSLRVPVIINEQTDPALYAIGRVWSLLRRAVYPLADRLVCPVAASLARFQAMTRVRGCVIPNPVEVPPFVHEERVAGDRVHVLAAMGRLVPQKGFDLLLTAFSKIVHLHPGWALYIYGAGTLLSELQAQAVSLHLQDKVRFCGAVPDPFNKLRAADLFVLSSRFEGFGMALAEAMACGLPVVSFDCPEGPGEIVRDGVDGLLVPALDVDALAAALDRLMGDASLRQKLAERATEVRERFSRDRIMALWQRLFEQLTTPQEAGESSASNRSEG